MFRESEIFSETRFARLPSTGSTGRMLREALRLVDEFSLLDTSAESTVVVFGSSEFVLSLNNDFFDAGTDSFSASVLGTEFLVIMAVGAFSTSGRVFCSGGKFASSSKYSMPEITGAVVLQENLQYEMRNHEQWFKFGGL